MAPRRQYRKRIKKRPLSERSEFRTLPVSGAGGAGSPCEARTAIVGVAFSCLLLLASPREVGRPPGRDPACPSGRATFLFHPSGRRSNVALLARRPLPRRLRSPEPLADEA